MSRTIQVLIMAAFVFVSVYVVEDAVSQGTPTASRPAATAPGSPASSGDQLAQLSAEMDLLLKRVGEPTSKRDSLYEFMLRRFNDMDKRFDKIDRALKDMGFQVDRIESRR